MATNSPRLRKATKTSPLFPLNSFPATFVDRLSEHICYHLATRGGADLEGKDWEKIFASCIGASWTPSNVGLDDITHNPSSTAWGAKTVKARIDTSSQARARRTPQKIRLISGRNSPDYSFDSAVDRRKHNPNEVGSMVLEIWNARVREVRAKFENLRTVVLMKGEDLHTAAVFEFDTDMFIPGDLAWEWNTNGNLEGRMLSTNQHKFTWQPHGSQFTIVEEVPVDALRLQFKQPDSLPLKAVLEQVGFNSSFCTKI